MSFLRFFCYLNLKTLRQLGRGIVQRRLPGLAAEMAYSNALALFPAMVGLLTVIGMLKISPDRIDTLTRQWLSVAPQEVIDLIESFLQQIRLPNGEEVFPASFLITVWIASTAISVAMSAMDQIYQTPLVQRRPFWKARLTAVLLTVGSLAVLLTASFLVFISDLIVQFLTHYTTSFQTEFWQAWGFLRWVFAFTILSFGFGVLYRFGPSQWQIGTPLLPGAIIGALLWVIISQGFRVYLAYFGSRLSLTYGALSAGILLLLWLNLSSLALLIGAQLNVTVGQAMLEEQKSKSIL
jgi:membrane protein